MSNMFNEAFLEQKFEEGVAMGMSDDVAEQFAIACLNGDSLDDFDGYADQSPSSNLCLCGEPLANNGPDCYSHMSRGY